MSNQNKYRFSDFTHEAYDNLLAESVANYAFLNYDLNKIYNESNYIILRHDIDMSVHEAFNLAKIEAKHNIKATYFVLLHSDFYNLFEKEITELVTKILALGHNLGLHFDSHYYNISKEEELESYLEFEKGILEKIFDTKIEVFSFHNTNDFVLGCKQEKYAGMVNTYSSFFQDKSKIAYCSDSFGYWRFERLEDILRAKKYSKIQILTHPEWWTKEVLPPKERIYKTIEGRRKKTKEKYHDFLKKYNLEPIGWE